MADGITFQTAVALSMRSVRLSVVSQDRKNNLGWVVAVAGEANAFNIERNSDGQHFSAIATEPSSSSVTEYSYIDAEPKTGKNYYRIVARNTNGTFVYSNIAVAKTQASDGFSLNVSPNPLSGADPLYVKISARDIQGPDWLILTDAAGARLYQTEVSHTVTYVSMEGFTKGVYIPNYTDGTRKHTVRIIKL